MLLLPLLLLLLLLVLRLVCVLPSRCIGRPLQHTEKSTQSLSICLPLLLAVRLALLLSIRLALVLAARLAHEPACAACL